MCLAYPGLLWAARRQLWPGPPLSNSSLSPTHQLMHCSMAICMGPTCVYACHECSWPLPRFICCCCQPRHSQGCSQASTCAGPPKYCAGSTFGSSWVSRNTSQFRRPGRRPSLGRGFPIPRYGRALSPFSGWHLHIRMAARQGDDGALALADFRPLEAQHGAARQQTPVSCSPPDGRQPGPASWPPSG